GDDADDGAPGGVGSVVLESTAERIEVRPVLAGHCLVDDADGRTGRRVAAVEEAPRPQGKAQRLHVTRADGAVVRVVMERPVERHALRDEAAGAAFPDQGNRAAETCGRDAGQLANLLERV